MGSSNGKERDSSRREFLKKAPLGVLGALALATLGGGLFGRSRRRVDLPSDSIYRPRDGGPEQI